VAAANRLSNAAVKAAPRLIGTPSISMAEPHRTGKCRKMFRASTGTLRRLDGQLTCAIQPGNWQVYPLQSVRALMGASIHDSY